MGKMKGWMCRGEELKRVLYINKFMGLDGFFHRYWTLSHAAKCSAAVSSLPCCHENNPELLSPQPRSLRPGKKNPRMRVALSSSPPTPRPFSDTGYQMCTEPPEILMALENRLHGKTGACFPAATNSTSCIFPLKGPTRADNAYVQVSYGLRQGQRLTSVNEIRSSPW